MLRVVGWGLDGLTWLVLFCWLLMMMQHCCGGPGGGGGQADHHVSVSGVRDRDRGGAGRHRRGEGGQEKVRLPDVYNLSVRHYHLLFIISGGLERGTLRTLG